MHFLRGCTNNPMSAQAYHGPATQAMVCSLCALATKRVGPCGGVRRVIMNGTVVVTTRTDASLERETDRPPTR